MVVVSESPGKLRYNTKDYERRSRIYSCPMWVNQEELSIFVVDRPGPEYGLPVAVIEFPLKNALFLWGIISFLRKCATKS